MSCVQNHNVITRQVILFKTVKRKEEINFFKTSYICYLEIVQQLLIIQILDCFATDYCHPIQITNPWFQILIFILIQKLPDHAGRRFHKYNL